MATLFWLAAVWQTWRNAAGGPPSSEFSQAACESPQRLRRLAATHQWPRERKGAGGRPMTREDARALLNMAQDDRDPPPPIEPEKMARLFGEVMSREARRHAGAR
jgi:hypothetical protein